MKASDADVLFGSGHLLTFLLHWKRKGTRSIKRKIDIGESIKRLGVYHVPIKLFRTVTAEIKVWVVKE